MLSHLQSFQADVFVEELQLFVSLIKQVLDSLSFVPENDSQFIHKQVLDSVLCDLRVLNLNFDRIWKAKEFSKFVMDSRFPH